ncbi:MAG TPA: hypothetical protein VGI50_03125 [Solirubrobacteraceae bacterium]
MALPFIPSDAAMLALQAGVVAAPRRAPEIPQLARFRSPGWAIVPIASIVVVVFAIRYISDTATGLTYLALVAVPPLAAVALAWGVRGGRTSPARTAGAIALTALLFALAWVFHSSLVGEGSAALLSALSCVTLGVLLAAVAPPGWLKLGILAMAAADTWLVASDLLQAPNATLVAAAPVGHLPQLQSELFGSVSMGYGDLFVAGLLGAVLASDRRRQLQGALITLVLAGLFDLLFLTLSELPATVPVALTVIVLEAADRLKRPSADRRPRLRAGAIPRQAK